MATATIDRASFHTEEIASSYPWINPIASSCLAHFRRIVKTHFFIHVAFVLLLCTEIVLLSLFFAFLAQSALLAIGLALVFLTAFSYFVLRVYLHTKKQEQFAQLTRRYIKTCIDKQQIPAKSAEHYLALSQACWRCSEQLQRVEHRIYRFPQWLKSFTEPITQFTAWYHWRDVYQMRELLLLAAIQHDIELIKCEPTSLESHASLANSYVMLSTLYTPPKDLNDPKFISLQKQKFEVAAKRAVEELKIISEFAPKDPWVHAQLAYSYRDLQMPNEEIREYEILLQLSPHDPETLFKLGILYFQQGLNALGLRVYNHLKQSYPKKAEELISFYGHNIRHESL